MKVRVYQKLILLAFDILSFYILIVVYKKVGRFRLYSYLGQHQQEIDELKGYFQEILMGGFERFATFNASIYNKYI